MLLLISLLIRTQIPILIQALRLIQIVKQNYTDTDVGTDTNTSIDTIANTETGTDTVY